jgi:hypothetical protein
MAVRSSGFFGPFPVRKIMYDHRMSKTASFDQCSIRRVEFGAINPAQLLVVLEKSGIKLNDAALELFAHPNFLTSPDRRHLSIVQVSVADLGFTEGANTRDIYAQAAEQGLALCPIELAAHYRLEYLDQPEGSIGFPPTKHCAPHGSVTVAVEPISQDEDTPKGFYLRRIEGILWLRGYHSSPEFVWSPHDQFAFGLADRIG